MRVLFYKTREDWVKGFGQICDCIGDVKDCHCFTVESRKTKEDENTVYIFVGKNGRVFVREAINEKSALFDSIRIIARHYANTMGNCNRLYLSRSDGVFAVNGSILDEERTIDAATKLFMLLDNSEKTTKTTVVSFPKDVSELHKCSVYSRQTDFNRYAELFQLKDLKEF